MSSILSWVGPNLPRWMARVSGVALIVVGLLEPVWTAQPVTPVITQIASALPALAPNQPAQPVAEAAPAGLAMTPPMGWNGYNRFVHDVTESRVEEQARSMIMSGMAAAGYKYVNIDGGWDLMWRGPHGVLVPDPRKFPHGIKPVVDYVHSLGLKFGIYTSVGQYNCAYTSAGSFGHFQQDAATFAAWGVDYVKVDWCFIPYKVYRGMNHRQVGELLAGQMGAALAATGRPMIYDVNDPLVVDQTWTWAPKLSHLWRTADDSRDGFASLLMNFTRNVGRFGSARPGNWNDPDMLEIGNGGMTDTEYQAEFSLWAEMAAPLIAGTDLATMSDQTRAILTNAQVIGVDQDPLGRQGYPVASSGGLWVLVKPLAGGDRAIVLFNATGQTRIITTSAAEVGVTGGSRYVLDNLWTGVTSRTGGTISATVAPHGVVMYIVSAMHFGKA